MISVKLKAIQSGAEGRTRTDTGLPLLDFESSASTSFTTPAKENQKCKVTIENSVNGALSETRTRTGRPATPSRWCVYQFHHQRIPQKVGGLAYAKKGLE